MGLQALIANMQMLSGYPDYPDAVFTKYACPGEHGKARDLPWSICQLKHLPHQHPVTIDAPEEAYGKSASCAQWIL